MKLILLGASGMVGAGALREALAAPQVEAVLSVGRRPCGIAHPKLRELLLPDLFDIAAVVDQLAGYDACIWAAAHGAYGVAHGFRRGQTAPLVTPACTRVA